MKAEEKTEFVRWCIAAAIYAKKRTKKEELPVA